MGIRIAVFEDDRAILYESATDWAFGPVFDSIDHAEAFLAWTKCAHFWSEGRYGDDDLQASYREWLRQLNPAPVGSRTRQFIALYRAHRRHGFDQSVAREIVRKLLDEDARWRRYRIGRAEPWEKNLRKEAS
jgi:hypothetical protein